MKKILVFYCSLLLILGIAVFYNGCAQLDKNAVTAPDITGVHPAGWIDTASPNFHGNSIANANWSMSQCKTCHGGDYRGGSTGFSCYKCHTSADGPEACNTCHGSRDPSYEHNWPPQSLDHKWNETDRGVGVHNHHLSFDSTERYSARVECNECHATVNSFSDTSHIDPSRNGKAKITFGVLAHNSIGGGIVPNPTYDPVNNTCSQVYCHGYFRSGNLNFTPVYNDPESVVCGSCHGNPQTGNPNPNTPPHDPSLDNHCWWCHGSVIDSTMTIIQPSKHINGVVDLGFNRKPRK